MMAWLSGWLMEIIIIVLIASFADLLLPNKSMQRYVKTVIGLFILMLLLSPVLKLFRMDWDTDKLLRAIEQESNQSSIQTNAGNKTQSQGGNKSLTAILQTGEQLRMQDQNSAQQLVEQQIAEAVRAGIESQFDGRVDEVKVTTVLSKEGGLTLSGIRVVWSGEKAIETKGVSPNPIRAIEPIQPVSRIKPIGTNDIAAGAEETTGSKSKGTLQDHKNDDTAAIVAFIRKEWQLKPDAIDVEIRSEK